jgi:enoyl-CoA hydratase/carnithine racemase
LKHNPTTFLYHQSDGIATITLNRPERLNAITFEVYRELTDAFAALRDEKEVRVIVITGAGRAFCSGGDVIAFIFVKVGLAGTDMGATYLLPRVVGLAKASELLMTGDFISAPEAERIGLYNRVVARDHLEEVTREYAEKLARGPALGLAKTKEMLNREMNLSFDAALEAEAVAQALCMQHPDFREAHTAFIEKRPATFK